MNKKITQAALLTALAILIPMVMPLKLVIGPASFTLASHVPIFIAMFLSPSIAVIVAVGAAIGFLFSGLPIVITMRALSHIIFAYIGAKWFPRTKNRFFFSFVVNLIHGAAEVVVVFLLTDMNFNQDYFFTLFVLVGIGTVIHGMVDFEIAYFIKERIGIDPLPSSSL